MKICPECGTLLSSGDTVECGTCGAKIKPEKSAGENPVSKNEQESETDLDCLSASDEFETAEVCQLDTTPPKPQKLSYIDNATGKTEGEQALQSSNNDGFEEASKLQQMLEREFDDSSDPFNPGSSPEKENDSIIKEGFFDSIQNDGQTTVKPDKPGISNQGKGSLTEDPYSPEKGATQDQTPASNTDSDENDTSLLVSQDYPNQFEGTTGQGPGLPKVEPPADMGPTKQFPRQQPEENVSNSEPAYIPDPKSTDNKPVTEQPRSIISHTNTKVIEGKSESEFSAEHNTASDFETPHDDSTAVKLKTGTAYAMGNSIKFSGGVIFKPGERITVNDRQYRLKKAPGEKRSRNYLWQLVAAASTLALLFLILTPPETVPGGGIAIVPVDASTGAVLDRSVAIADGGLGKHFSKPNGIISYQSVNPGIYSITLTADGYDPITIKDVLLLKGGFATLSPKMTRKTVNARTTNHSSEPIKKVTSRRNSSGKINYGALKINVHPDYASFSLNDKIIGIGNQTYTKIRPGTYKLKGRANGYKDFLRTINIQPGKTLTFQYRMKIDLDSDIESGSSKSTP